MAGARYPSVWVAYQVTTMPRQQSHCADGARPLRVMLEPSTITTVLARLESGGLTRLLTVSGACEIDGGHLPVVWLDGVSSSASAAWLATIARGPGSNTRRGRIAEGALAVLVWHTDRGALDAVIDIAKGDAQAEMRGRALFWLAQRAGRDAVATITSAVENDPELAIKKKAVFALAQLPNGEGVPHLIRVARTHSSRDVRKQAMFWLGQSRDARATSFFEEVLTR